MGVVQGAGCKLVNELGSCPRAAAQPSFLPSTQHHSALAVPGRSLCGGQRGATNGASCHSFYMVILLQEDLSLF